MDVPAGRLSVRLVPRAADPRDRADTLSRTVVEWRTVRLTRTICDRCSGESDEPARERPFP
jgi:hypothetical protein